jgi:hypothetical protein
MSYAREAQSLALKHGAPEAAIDSLRTRDTLLSILQDAKIDHGICEDVADACELNSLTALALASGLMDKAVVAELCYLTTDEAEVSCPVQASSLARPSRCVRSAAFDRCGGCLVEACVSQDKSQSDSVRQSS